MEPISRRRVLGKTGLFSALAAPMPLLATPSAERAGTPDAPAPARKLKVIVCGGHPGDPEYGCGGTVARYTELGHEVVLLYLNQGEWPPNPVAEAGKKRRAEASKACEILGARPLYAGHPNSLAVVDRAHAEAFRKIIEAEKPDILFTHWIIDNHPDHRAISMLAYESWLKLEKKFALYFYEVSNGEDTVQFAPTHYVDITATEPLKRQACYAHASQTPDRFYALQDLVCRMRGVESGHRLAEGFIRHVQSPEVGLPTA